MRCTLLTLLVLQIACKDKKPEPAPPQPPHDGVTLIQPGAAPHQVLRYHLTKGVKTTSELTYDLDVHGDVPHDAQPEGAPRDAASGDGHAGEQTGPAPTLIVTLETVVDDVLADGTAKLRVTVVGSRLREQPGSHVDDAVRAQAAAAQGVVFHETLAPDGQVSDAQIDAAGLPTSARARLDSLVQGLAQVAMRLPPEPIGIGATWRERKPLPEGGIRAISETTYTLTSWSGTTVAYTAAGSATGATQTIEQDGMKVEVSNPRGHAEIKGSVDLSSYAVNVTSSSTFAAAMTIDAPTGTPGAGASTVEITVGIQMTPATPNQPAPANATPDGGP